MRLGLEFALLAGAAVVLVSAMGVRVGMRYGVPSLLIFLAFGLVMGEAGLGLRFDNAALTRDLGLIALVVILAEGGLTTDLDDIRPVLGLAAVLATIGVVITVALVAVAAHAWLSMDWRTSVLLGGVVSSTDAAVVFSVLRRLPLRARPRAILEAESGINDAPAIVIVSLAASATWGVHPWWQSVGLGVYELAAGAAAGWLIGMFGRWLLARIALPAAGLYPLATLAFVVVAFAATSLAHASGFLAVYICALLLGSARLPHRRSVLGFSEGLAWLAQIGLFVLLGLLASPSRLPAAVLPAVIAGGVLTLVARPAAVWACAIGFRVPWRERAFLSAAGLRGAVPIVLATVPLADHVVGAGRVFDITFVLVVIFTAVQAPSLPWVARRLGMLSADSAGELTVDSAPLDDMNALLLDIAVPDRSRLSGEYVSDLRLPREALVSLVVRDGGFLVPDSTTRIRSGDRLLVVTTQAARPDTERRLRAVSRAGILAAWFGETGARD